MDKTEVLNRANVICDAIEERIGVRPFIHGVHPRSGYVTLSGGGTSYVWSNTNPYGGWERRDDTPSNEVSTDPGPVNNSGY